MTEAGNSYHPDVIVTAFGDTIAGTISTTPHAWVADADGLFHTTTDLRLEWQSYYDTMMAGHADTLGFIQRLEGNSQAVFQNTGLSRLDETRQSQAREDVQRAFDAMSVAMTRIGLDGHAPVTVQDYLYINSVILGDPVLQELALQGHGLNNPPVERYRGYTNDFQNNVDNRTRYIGGGLTNNENALANFFDDVVISHLGFSVILRDGMVVQLNQNADAEDELAEAVGALNQAGLHRVYTAADFSATPGSASSEPALPPPDTRVPGANQMLSAFGEVIPTTITVNGHSWVANGYGLYRTATNLAAEWRGYYQVMLDGRGDTLTGIQRLAGNAEAVFRNTRLAELAATDPYQLDLDREDVQRALDAIAGTMQTLGLDPKAPLTGQGYRAISLSLQSNAALHELAIQGHGLRGHDDPRYDGYTNDFQNRVDEDTLFLGSGLNTGENALTDFFDDNIITHLMFPVVMRNGELQQLNQNGDEESTLSASTEALNEAMFGHVYTAADFGKPGEPVAGTRPPAGMVTTYFGETIAASMTVNGHAWTIGGDGRFHTTTDLTAEWRGYYAKMLAGQGDTLTATQRLAGNAQAVFQNTDLANVRRYNAAKQQSFRENVQRELDAIAATMFRLGLGGTPLNELEYLAIENALRADAALEELAIQGHGLNDAPSIKYWGYTHDFQNNSDNRTYYVGGGAESGERAIATLLDDAIMSHLPFPTVFQNGRLVQLNQNGDAEDDLDEAVEAFNEAAYRRVYVAGDFSTNPTATGPVVYVSPTAATAPANPDPKPNARQMVSLTGAVIPTRISAGGHLWVADADGRYQTTTDLNLEWNNAYQAALKGRSVTLMQHWQANAQAVFLNTRLGEASEGQQGVFRADAQRQMDAIVTIMKSLGLGDAPLTVTDYLAIQEAMQGNAALLELAIQGHGLNSPPHERYYGYTNDFQWFDGQTLYVGGGHTTGEEAVGEFFDDNILTHIGFPAIPDDGGIQQLNQNGNDEDTVQAAVAAMNATLFTRLYTAADFRVPGEMPPPPPARVAPTVATLYGDTIARKVTLNGHVWTADADGEFQTTTDIGMQWRGWYKTMLAGRGDTLNPLQRLAANIEAVFENTAINWSWMGADREAAYRMDVQRELDTIAEAMRRLQVQEGIDPDAPLTEHSYLRIAAILQGDPILQELALQGHGVGSPPSDRYAGATNTFMAGADWSTHYVGGGTSNGELALPYFFHDLLPNLPFATAWQNGQWVQLDQRGDVAGTVIEAATTLNNWMYRQVLVAADFSDDAAAVGPVVLLRNAPSATAQPIASISVPAGMIRTLDGSLIASTITVNGHVWTTGADGALHTATNLAAEWAGHYQALQAGTGDSLTAIQRLEANAEAVFRNTDIATLANGARNALREAVQRVIDAIAGSMEINATTLGLPANAQFVQGSYNALERTLRTHSDLMELAWQGRGVSSPPATRYTGFTGLSVGVDNVTKYVGGGVSDGKGALSVFMPNNIMGNLAYGMAWRNGRMMQLGRSGTAALSTSDAIVAMNDAMFSRTYRKADFSRTA